MGSSLRIKEFWIESILLRRDGVTVNVKRVERIWRREGLKVPARQPKRACLWLNDGPCIRLRPERPDHVWSYDFVEQWTRNGRKYRMLNVIDEFTRECQAIRIARKLKALDVIDVLSNLFSLRRVPGHILSDNGPECRCMNIPARYAAGYLGDIGVPKDPAPMDFSAWFEVYLDGPAGPRWYTFEDSTVERGSFGPVRWSATEVCCRHLATVFWLIP